MKEVRQHQIKEFISDEKKHKIVTIFKITSKVRYIERRYYVNDILTKHIKYHKNNNIASIEWFFKSLPKNVRFMVKYNDEYSQRLIMTSSIEDNCVRHDYYDANNIYKSIFIPICKFNFAHKMIIYNIDHIQVIRFEYRFDHNGKHQLESIKYDIFDIKMKNMIIETITKNKSEFSTNIEDRVRFKTTLLKKLIL